jgi:hypothetical protein
MIWPVGHYDLILNNTDYHNGSDTSLESELLRGANAPDYDIDPFVMFLDHSFTNVQRTGKDLRVGHFLCNLDVTTGLPGIAGRTTSVTITSGGSSNAIPVHCDISKGMAVVICRGYVKDLRISRSFDR